MKRAVIDIGTNSVLMLIAEQCPNDHLRVITDQAKTARLGEGLAATGLLSNVAMTRTLAILRDYAEAIAAEGVSEVICFGTAALRRAKNAQAFIQQVQQQLNWTVRVLSGREEAEYTFAGVMGATSSRQETAIAIDIGGGSTEIVYGSRIAGISIQQSFPIGAVTLKSQFHLADQLLPAQRTALLGHCQGIFHELPPALDHQVLFTGGTATTIPAIALQLTQYDWQQVEGFISDLGQVEQLYQTLNAMDLEKRSQLAGMEPGRADIILPALLILKALLSQLSPPNSPSSEPSATSFTCTVRGARYGILMPQP